VVKHKLPPRSWAQEAGQGGDDLALHLLVGPVHVAQTPLVQQLLPLTLEVHEGLVEGAVSWPAEGLQVSKQLVGGRVG
jgi:hypothetical protein